MLWCSEYHGHHHLPAANTMLQMRGLKFTALCMAQEGKKKAGLGKKGQWLNLRTGAVLSARETALLQVPATGEVPFMIIFLLI